MTDQVFPFRPGDWAVCANDTHIAKVKSVWDLNGEQLFDLIIYSLTGEKVGRESPAMGGPRSFEPACSMDGWERIAEPDFPIRVKWVADAGGRSQLRHWAGDRLPPANWKKPKRRPRIKRTIDPDYQRVLELIADGHNDPRRLASEVLGRKLAS